MGECVLPDYKASNLWNLAMMSPLYKHVMAKRKHSCIKPSWHGFMHGNSGFKKSICFINAMTGSRLAKATSISHKCVSTIKEPHLKGFYSLLGMTIQTMLPKWGHWFWITALAVGLSGKAETNISCWGGSCGKSWLCLSQMIDIIFCPSVKFSWW